MGYVLVEPAAPGLGKQLTEQARSVRDVMLAVAVADVSRGLCVFVQVKIATATLNGGEDVKLTLGGPW